MAKDYSPPDGFDPKLMTPFLNPGERNFDQLTGVNRVIVPFKVCGDMSAYDSDVTYPLQVRILEISRNIYFVICYSCCWFDSLELC